MDKIIFLPNEDKHVHEDNLEVIFRLITLVLAAYPDTKIYKTIDEKQENKEDITSTFSYENLREDLDKLDFDKQSVEYLMTMGTGKEKELPILEVYFIDNDGIPIKWNHRKLTFLSKKFIKSLF